MSCNILLCTLGASWAVVPEVFAFLAPARLPLYREHSKLLELEELRTAAVLLPPDEVWICTTQGAATRRGIDALGQWRDQLPSAPVLRLWQAQGTDELATQAECDHLQELVLRTCLLAHERSGAGQVVLSLAGGRKTMSADLQWAGHLFGCQALIHVVAREGLPAEMRDPTPEMMAGPIPSQFVDCIMPLVAERCRRSKLLDVDLDQRGPVSSMRFPLPLPPPGALVAWSAPSTGRLRDEVRERERAGSRLLGNFLVGLAEDEHHENWRSLYRLPPRVIDRLRSTKLGACHRDWLIALPKADIHRHVGGCLDIPGQRTVGQAIWASLTDSERGAALAVIKSWLDQRHWPDQWDRRLRDRSQRSHQAAALLVHATDEQLEWNLYGSTAPRVALKGRHPRGFDAYELPGELSGSALLSHPAAIETYAERIVRDAVADGLLYVELRGSPQKYGDGLRFLESFRAAIQRAVLQLDLDRRPQFRFTVIGDRRRKQPLAEVIRLAVMARAMMPDFLAGLDIAGDEAVARPAEIAGDFMPAFENCLPITIHAGEGEKAARIWEAAYHLHADRIGHGLTICEYPELASRFRDRGICLELCPTSNREVVGFRDPLIEESAALPEYPLPQLWRMGVPLTICTDNPGISRTTVSNEYLAAARMAPNGLTCWDMLAMLKQGFRYAFMSSETKERLLKRADAQVYEIVLQEFPDV